MEIIDGMRRAKYLMLSSLVVASASFSASGAAQAKQCIYNHFGKSGLIVNVTWYEAENVVFTRNVTKNTIEVHTPEGVTAKPKKLDSENISAGFSSCRNDLASRAAVVSVVGGDIARIAAQQGASILGAVVTGAIATGYCAAAAGITVGTAGTGAPAGAALCIAGGLSSGSVGYGVTRSLSSLIPNAKDVIYAGIPSHYNDVNIGGTAFNPWYDENGAKIETAPPMLPMPIMVKGKMTESPGDVCTKEAKKRNMRWNGKVDATEFPGNVGTQLLCQFTLPDVYRFIPFQLKKGVQPDLKAECDKLAKKRGVVNTNVPIPVDPIKNIWACRLYG